MQSDLPAIRAALPDVAFSGMINPVDLNNRQHADVLADIARALEAGARDLALWDIDPAITPARLGEFLRSLARLASQHDRDPQFSFIPITWEEMDWEFPRYRRGAPGG